jgi:hypothetical protein
VLQALVTLAAAAAEEETSQAAFYISGGVLAAAAVIVSAIGVLRHETFPPTRGAMVGVIGLFVVLVAVTVATAIITG